MSVTQIPEHAEEVSLSDVREGERVIIEYRSAQSHNIVQREGEVKEADRLGTRTRSFVLAADNGTDYSVNSHRHIRSTGEKNRKLSSNNAEIYRLDGLEIESWEDHITHEGIHIFREKTEVFDCPWCGAEDSASVNSVNEDNVTVSCGSCRDVRTLSDQPVTMALKVTR